MSNPLLKSKDPRDKNCYFCENKLSHIDYKNMIMLRQFINYYAKIKPRYYTGTCLKHQKALKKAIERARFMALIPYYR